MIIDLASIGTTPTAFEFSFEPADIDLEGETLKLTDKAVLSGETVRSDERAHIRGSISTEISHDCTRCLDPVSKRLEFPFSATFVDSTDQSKDFVAEVSDEALDESVAEDGKIDMAELVREQLLLVVPEQIFCRDDCKGLCTQCGANLNLIDCKCADDEVDPRWAALKSLK